jgi:acetyl esterase/lipase
MVWVHGGGWTSGSRLPIPATATRLLARGYAVASIDYRLSGQAIWPAQIQDCKAAIRFLRANAALWALDPHRIGVMGSSAGGHLVAALATMGDVGTTTIGAYTVDLEGSIGAHVGTSSRVQCAIDQFGPTSMWFANDLPTFDHDAPTSPESNLIGGALQDNVEKWTSVDPITFLSPDDPPILAMHGTDDTTVPFHQSELLLRAAGAIGHASTLFAVQGNGHGGPGFLAPDAIAAMDAFLDRVLRDLPTVTVAIQATDGSANESGDAGAFTLTRSGSTIDPLTVRLWLAGTTTPGEDVDAVPLFATIPAGQSSLLLPLLPRQDALVEGDEQAVLHIAASDTYRIDHTASHAAVVLGDDEVAAGLPILSTQQVDAAATEAAGNPGALRFVRTGSTAAPLVVTYELAGTATNGSDYASLPGTLTIPAGAAASLAIVAPLQDPLREPGETAVLRLLPATTYALGVSRSGHVILADDDRLVALPVVGVLAIQPIAGEPAVAGRFAITRTGPTTAPLSVSIAVGGTATPGADFAPIANAVLIPAGAARALVQVDVLDDFAMEGIESVAITAQPGAGYLVGAATSQLLWLGDDEAPTPSPSALRLDVSPLEVGRTGSATIGGGAPGGIASLWIAFGSGYLPLPPFGTVQLDVLQAGEFVSGAFGSDGSATLAVAIPTTPALAGLQCWWQAVGIVPSAPFLLLTDGVGRTISGPRRF